MTIFIDLSKAFDSVDNETLLSDCKTESYDFQSLDSKKSETLKVFLFPL